MAKRSHQVAFEKVTEDIERWLEEEEDEQQDNLHELYSEGESSEDESEEGTESWKRRAWRHTYYHAKGILKERFDEEKEGEFHW